MKRKLRERNLKLRGAIVDAAALDDVIRKVSEFKEVYKDATTVQAFGDLKRTTDLPNEDAYLTNFDASFNDRELVYGITCHTPTSVPEKGRKRSTTGRISVVFRGSVETNDWLHTITIPFEEITKIQTFDDEKSNNNAFMVEGPYFSTVLMNESLAKKLKTALGDQKLDFYRGFLTTLL